jgi:hypothetical protein
MMHNESTESRTERIVMRRVHRVHALRPFMGGAALAVVIFVVALWGIGREVWVSRVFENAPSMNFAADLHFFLAAFINTRFVVQALILASLISILYLARECARLIASRFVLKTA